MQILCTFPNKCIQVFPGLSRNAATLLSVKLVDRVLSYGKEENINEETGQERFCLTDKELSGLQYLGGYVMQNLHKKFMKSKTVNCLNFSKPWQFLKLEN